MEEENISLWFTEEQFWSKKEGIMVWESGRERQGHREKDRERETEKELGLVQDDSKDVVCKKRDGSICIRYHLKWKRHSNFYWKPHGKRK